MRDRGIRRLDGQAGGRLDPNQVIYYRLDAGNVFGGDFKRLALAFVDDHAPQLDHAVMHTTLAVAAGAHCSFCISASRRSRMAASSLAAGCATRARLTMACMRLERVTIPTTWPPQTTGTRLMRRRSIRSTMSSIGVTSSTVCTSGVITSETLLPCEWLYSAAIRPGPIRNSSQRERRRSVLVSRRRSRWLE